MAMLNSLYSTDILTLSASLENAHLDTPHASVRKVSKICGSWVEIDVNVANGVISDAALRVQACALGQASAAILRGRIVGASLSELREARDGLRAMLKTSGPAPTGRFSRLSLLNGVKDYPARHQSTMLSFDAAVEAGELAGLG